jgi:hypothetical protein
MIAPVRAPHRRPRESANSLATARRAVAAALLGRNTPQPDPSSPLSNWRAWAFVVWVLAITAACFVLNAWSVVRPY